MNVLDPLINSAHTLIAGTTGSGKSVLLNDVLSRLSYTVDGFCSFFDLKRVELIDYKYDVGLCSNYISEPEDVLEELDFLIFLMEGRYEDMASRGLKKYDGYHHYIVIDELADMITIEGVLERLVKIGRLGRAANIHLLCATQDPSRRTLPAQLMQNFTCTVALRCRSAIESRQIIGVPGAELLPKYGYGYRWDADGIEKFAIPFK